MALCRAVDNYLIYLSDLLAMIFSKRPESLKSSEQVTLAFVLGHQTLPRLISALVNKKVNQLSYQGMKELSGFFETRLEFPLFEFPDLFERAVLLIEIRNIIVHNRGVVNDTFSKRAPFGVWKKGKRVELSTTEVYEHIRFLADSVYGLELGAAVKFDIAQPIETAISFE